MKKVKVWIGILACIIVILSVTIIIIKFNSKNVVSTDVQENGEIETELKKQQSYNQYFSVEKYLQNFFVELMNGNSEQIYYLLYEDYINDNGITIDNIFTKITNVPDFKKFDVNEMYVEEDENQYSNYVKGTLLCQEKKYIWYGLVEVSGGSYAIYPLSEKDYVDIIKGDKKIERKKIKPNAYNEFMTKSYSREDICFEYFEDYIDKALNNTDLAYNLLDNEYKNKRFDNDEGLFKRYIEEKRKQLEESVMTSYSVVYDGYNVKNMVIKDNFDNYYIVKENAVLDYTIQLDNYTIKDEKFNQEYAELEENKKVYNNLEEITKMLNGKDYKHLYNKLNEEFRKNKFPTEEAFKTYMKNTYYDYNILSVSSIAQEKSNIYICKANLKDGVSTAAEIKSFTVIMNLLDNNDYVISFTVENL